MPREGDKRTSTWKRRPAARHDNCDIDRKARFESRTLLFSFLGSVEKVLQIVVVIGDIMTILFRLCLPFHLCLEVRPFKSKCLQSNIEWKPCEGDGGYLRWKWSTRCHVQGTSSCLSFLRVLKPWLAQKFGKRGTIYHDKRDMSSGNSSSSRFPFSTGPEEPEERLWASSCRAQ